jgi:hypothetical protein
MQSRSASNALRKLHGNYGKILTLRDVDRAVLTFKHGDRHSDNKNELRKMELEEMYLVKEFALRQAWQTGYKGQS